MIAFRMANSAWSIPLSLPPSNPGGAGLVRGFILYRLVEGRFAKDQAAKPSASTVAPGATGDDGVIAAQQHRRDFHASELAWAGKLRMLQQTVLAVKTEAFVGRAVRAPKTPGSSRTTASMTTIAASSPPLRM
jgi:hypothetical protein